MQNAPAVPTAQPAPATLIARPPVFDPIMVALALVAGLAWAGSLTLLPWVATTVAALGFLARFRRARGSVTVGPDGITARYLLRTVKVPWEDARWVVVANQPLRQRVVVRRASRPNLTLPLGASRLGGAESFDAAVDVLDAWMTWARDTPVVRKPRTTPRLALALLVVVFAAATAYDRPWYWIAWSEATTTPDPCAPIAAVTGGGTAAMTTRASTQSGAEFTECAYGRGWLGWRVAYRTFTRDGFRSGTATAAEWFSRTAATGLSGCIYSRGRLPTCFEGTHVESLDIGDDSALQWHRDNTARIIVRVGNVVAIVQCDPRNKEVMVELAQAAADAVALD